MFMPFCSYCGKSTNPQDKFCASCGKSLKSSQPNVPVPDQPVSVQQAIANAPKVSSNRVPEPSSEHDVMNLKEATPSITPQTETIKMILPDLMMIKGFGRFETYNLIVTDSRSIFAKLTNVVKEQAIKKHRAKVEAVKGVPGVFKWMAKINDARAYIDWYSEKTPDLSFNETPGNFAIENSSIIDIDVTDDGDEDFPNYDLVITAKNNVLKLKTQHDPNKLFSVYGLR
jgi:hypothetical protein